MVLINSFKFRLTFHLVLLGTLFASVQGQNVEKMIEKEVHALWQNVGETTQVLLTPEVISSHDEIHAGDVLYRIFDKSDGSNIGYVLTTSAMGRFDAFDYFIVYNKELKVQSVRVTVYRSSHGSAICNKRWLSQFAGFCGETLIYGKDIQAVSGATISGGSIVEDIQRGYDMMNILRNKKLI